MIEKCASVVSSWLLNKEVIREEERELYEYAVYSVLITIAPMLMAILFGIIMGGLYQSIILMIPFMTIRKYSGGYHAKNPIVCFLTSCLLLFLCISTSIYAEYNIQMFFLMLLSTLILIICSPIDSENRRLDQEEKQRYKIVTTTQTLFYMVVSLGLYAVNQSVYARCISIGMILSAGLQLPCLAKRCWKKRKNI